MPVIYISEACPVTFYQVGVPPVAGRNVVHLGQGPFSKQIGPYQQQIRYTQKWQKTDQIVIQAKSEIDNIIMQLVTCNGTVQKETAFEIKSTTIIGQTWRVYETVMQLADVPENEYYLLITAGTGDNKLMLYSEPQYVTLSDPDTMLYTYKHSGNYLDIIYSTGVEFQFRCESALREYVPGNKLTVYQDQKLNGVQLSAYPYDQYKLMVGGVKGAYGAPNWLAKKMNYIFSNNFVLVEGMQFLRADQSKMEANRAAQYPMAGWVLDVIPAINRYSNIYDLSLNDTISVAYNITAGIFGVLDGTPAMEQIKLLERK